MVLFRDQTRRLKRKKQSLELMTEAPESGYCDKGNFVLYFPSLRPRQSPFSSLPRSVMGSANVQRQR